MTESIKPERIANAIRMKNLNEKSFLIVEGISDQVLFNKFINKDNCDIEIAFGNLNVIAVVENLISGGYDGVLGIIDSDFRIINAESFNENPIFLSDFHDLEIMFITSNAFTDVLNSYNVEQKLVTNWSSFNEFRNHLFNISIAIGYLKLINSRNNYGIKFKPDNPDGRYLEYSKFVDVTTLSYLGDEVLVQTVLRYENQQARLHITGEHLLKDLNILDKKLDRNHLCNGHDIMQLIALSLKKNISNLNSKAVDFKQIEKEFALAYDSRFFINTNLYKKIKAWEQEKNKTVLNC